MKSNLLINNKGPRPIEIAPTLYGESGGILQIPRITVERNSAITINLSDWANFGGEGFQQGNIRLFHRGKALVLGIQIQITDETKSLVFESKLSELGTFDSRRLEGVWWIPNDNTDSTIVLTNTGGQYLTVTATLTRRPHIVGTAQTFNLLPHQTKILNVRDDFPQGDVFAKSKVLGLSLTHNGAEESLLAWTMIKDESKGYSNVATFINPGKVISKKYHGAGLHVGSIGNDQLKPVIALRNTTDADVDVNIKVPYTKEDGTNGTVSIDTVRLNPREVNEANMQAVINLNNIRTAGIEIEYTGNPGSVIASAQSVSASGNQVFRTLLWDPPALKSAASLYSFSIEGTSTTKGFIKNAGFKDESYVSHISWGTDGKYIIPVNVIKKGETIEIDVKKLRDEQIPDERGNVIPQNILKGQIHWSLRRSETTFEQALANRVPLVGQAMQIDIAKGVSYSYFCLICCENSANSFATLVPGNLQLNHPDNYQYRVLEDGIDCYGNPIYGRDVTSQAYDWSSTNTSVATVSNTEGSKGYVTTVAAGQTEIKTKINLPEYVIYGTCSGGGGPYRAEVFPFDKICNEETSIAGVGDNQVSFDKNIFEKEFEDETALIPGDCACIAVSSERQESANLTVIPEVILNVPQTAKDGDTVTFSVTTQGGTPTSYQWSFEAPQGAGNNPQVNFSNPAAASTTALAHWFAFPDQPCAPPPASPTNPYFNSTYQIKVKVTFSGGLEINRQMPFTVNAYWNPAGQVNPNVARVTGAPGQCVNSRGVWYVCGMGNLGRFTPPKEVFVPTTSQFYNKTDAHEQEHFEHWNVGNLFGHLHNPADFYARIQNFTGTSQQDLINKLSDELVIYSNEQGVLYTQLLPESERRAYAVSDIISPRYAYQRCGAFPE